MKALFFVVALSLSPSALGSAFGGQAFCKMFLLLDGMRYALVQEMARSERGLVQEDYVNVGSSSEAMAVTLSTEADVVTGLPSGTATIRLPSVGRFGWEIDADHYLIHIRNEYRGPLLSVRVPKALVRRTRVGLGESFARALGALRTATVFRAGERIRYREEDTSLMRAGVFLGASPDSARYRVQSASRREILIDRERVFKSLGEGEVFTPRFQVPSNVLWPVFIPGEEGPQRLFLDGAANLTSAAEFSALTEVQRLQFLMRYVTGVVEPHLGETPIEFQGVTTFSEVIRVGLGACRHLTTLLVAVLREGGYDAQLVTTAPVPGQIGHAWVKVRTQQGLVVFLDPMIGILMTLDEARAERRASPDSHAARFFLSRGTRVFAVSPAE